MKPISIITNPDNPIIPDEDLGHFMATFNRAVQLGNNEITQEVRIYTDQRDRQGWLEYQIVVTYQSGSSLTVGAIQRKPGEPSEFHS